VRVLVVGAGGVGTAVAAVAQRRSFFESMTLADIDEGRASAAAGRLGEPDRFRAARSTPQTRPRSSSWPAGTGPT
jgi:glycine/D-amino acid oxidase-like deaminating enzyme